MRTISHGIAAAALALATMGPMALVAAGSPATAGSVVAPAAGGNNCYTIRNGRIVRDDSGCSSSATGTSGSSHGGSGGSGTGTPGTATNTCFPVTSCHTSATGTPGRTY